MRRLNKPDKPVSVRKAINYAIVINALQIALILVMLAAIIIVPEIETSYDWHTGELFSLYRDWKMERCEEIIFDCDSSGVPHQHCMDVMIARKI